MWCQWIWSPFISVMAYGLFGSTSSTSSILTYFQIDPREETRRNVNKNAQVYAQEKVACDRLAILAPMRKIVSIFIYIWLEELYPFSQHTGVHLNIINSHPNHHQVETLFSIKPIQLYIYFETIPRVWNAVILPWAKFGITCHPRRWLCINAIFVRLAVDEGLLSPLFNAMNSAHVSQML